MKAKIDSDRSLTQDDVRILLAHGWEVSEDQREARLYSEEWSNIQVALSSTRWWIDENGEDGE